MSKAIIIERDYKGQYERYALTYEEFCNEFSSHFTKGMTIPEVEGSSYTLQPLVHLWYKPCEIGSEEWISFFTDMSWGLPESDINNGNLAYIREDLIQSLKSYLPQHLQTLPEQADVLLSDFLSKPNGHELFYVANIINMLDQEEVPLIREELFAITQRIIDISNVGSIPLLTAERVDAVCTLLNNGMKDTRSPEFPKASAEQMKEILLNCDIDVFADIVETVAVDNQEFYGPENQYSQEAIVQRERSISFMKSVINRKSSLREQILAAELKSSKAPLSDTSPAKEL